MISPSNGARLTPFHEQILRTALLPVEQTASEWKKLRVRPEDLYRPDASQLLPLLARALDEAGIETPELHGPLLRARRAAWLENQVLFRRLDVALDVLDSADIRALALKGVPLALRHYRDPSLRPMVDFDLLVDPDAARDAVGALSRAGWVLEWKVDDDFVARMSEVPCRSPDGRSMLDLHWRLVPWVGRSWTARDSSLWQEARPLPVIDRSTLAPAEHDLLLHVILHAYRSGWTYVPRWAADIVTVLRTSGDVFDWRRFLERVCVGRLMLPVGEALGYVRCAFGAPVPEPVLVTLAGAVATRRETHKHRRAEQPIAAQRHWLLGEAPDLRTSWARISVNYSRTDALRSLPPFLRGRTHVNRVWTLLFAVAGRRARRLWTERAMPRARDRGTTGARSAANDSK